MRVLVVCEYSGIVRDAFRAAGHTATSVDLLPSEAPGPHFVMDIFEFLKDAPSYDLIIAHPPCTYLAVSGNRWYAGRAERFEAVRWTEELFQLCNAKATRVCFENPVGVLPTMTRMMGRATQYIQPWMFGHPESKKTGLWLRNLPKLEPTHEKPEHIEQRIWKMPPGPDRQKERSRFYPGIAKAMADQWGSL